MDLAWKRHLKYMLENEVNCDVTFKVGKKQETIKAHKFILNMSSPVFQDMIESKKDLVIPDIRPEVFRELLRFCYNQDPEIKKDIALSLIYAARKYQLPLQEHFESQFKYSPLPHLTYKIKHLIDPDWCARLKHMLEKEIDCDVTFKVGEDQETIKAHKFILSMQSPVFEKMFNGSYCESEKDPIIPEICPASFRALLRYCYYECLDIHSDIALSVLYAAKKYMLPRLEVAARESLIKNLDKSEMLEIAKYAADTGDNALHEGCRNYIVLHLDELNVWDIHKQATETRDDVLEEIARNYLVRNLDALNVWGMFGHASSTGDDKLHAACRNYLVLTLNSSNIWEVCKYATVTGDEELHASCKKYLEENLNASNIWEVYTYATIYWDDELHMKCIQFIAENLNASNFWEVRKHAIDCQEEELLSRCNKYLEENLNGLNICEVYTYATDIGDVELQAICSGNFVEHLDETNVWEICKHATGTGDEQLHGHCKKYLFRTLDESNVWDRFKYFTMLGDDHLQMKCKTYLVQHINPSNIWQVCKYATDTGDEQLLLHCRNYLGIFEVCMYTTGAGHDRPQVSSKTHFVRNISASNVWEIYNYCTVVRDEELSSSCKTFLAKTLKVIWKVCKYAMDFGDGQLQEHCNNFLAKNLFVSDVWKVCKYGTDVGDEYLRAHCSAYLVKHKLDVIKPAFTVVDNDFSRCCQAYLKGHQDVWVIYEYAMNTGDQEILTLCRQYFEGDVRVVREALQTQAFLNIPYEVLLDFLHINNNKADHVDEYTGLKEETHTDIRDYQNCIGISISEIELFKACDAWAEAECFGQMIEPTGANKRTVLGQCLHLIRFPTMLQKDLLLVVYPTDILTQLEVSHLDYAQSGFPVNGRPEVSLPKQSDKKRVKHQQQGYPCQPVFPSRQRQFLVIPSGTNAPGALGTVFIESEVRVMLSRIWTSCPGRYKVTVRDEQLEWSWSVVLNTKHQNHFSGDNAYILPYLDIRPHVLMGAGIQYFVTAERMERSNLLYRQLNEKYIRIQFDELRIGCTGITVTQDPSTKCNIYALTLCLV